MTEVVNEQANEGAQVAPAEATAKPKKEKKVKEPKLPKEPKAEKVKAEPKAKDIKNGVNRPSTGVTKLVWDTADSLSQAKEAPIERAPLVDALKGKVEVGTIHTQYGRWRKYYGLTETKEQRQARLATVRDTKAETKAANKVKKDAEKAIKAEEKRVAEEAKAAAKAAEKQPAEAAEQA